ncbi:MAG: ATP phosphoribosyltransferase [Candidatus Bathyarchaeota archaeon]
MVKIKLVIPKGSIEKGTYEILERAGYVIYGQERTYRPTINDPEIELKILRPQEIPIQLEEGLHDIGITGEDWIKETGADVQILLKMKYGRVNMMIAVPNSWKTIDSLSDLLEHFWNEEKNVRISTEYLNTTARYVKSTEIYKKMFGDAEPLIITPWWRKGTNPKVSIFLSFGATEAKPPENADAIMDISETGTTLEQNDLKSIELISTSEAVLIANKKSVNDPEKKEKIYDILTLLKGVVEGRERLHIFVNVKEENLNKLIASLPSLKGPTISPLSTKGWFSINTVIEKKDFLEILPTIRRLAQGLVVHEPRQVLSLADIPGEKNE